MRRKLRALWLYTMKAGSAIKWWTVILLARGIGAFRSTRQIISAWPPAPMTLSPRIALFMHFDSAGRVSAPVLNYIQNLADNGFCVVFVTNSGKLTAIAQAQLRQLCAGVFIRRNRGYDFGAWRDIIDTLNLPQPDTRELIIINDSMYGPLRNLDQILARLDYQEADIWGLTESWQQRYHLQSYFLAFGPKALHAPAFQEFWRTVKPVPSKVFIVKEYEVGITRVMMHAGLRCKALWKYEDLVGMVLGQDVLDQLIRAERSRLARADPIIVTRKLQITRIRDAAAHRVAMNPTADLWRQLLLAGFPFIKRELLRKNPTAVEDVGDWVEVVRGHLGLDPEPILRCKSQA
jgi:hypothetical protein